MTGTASTSGKILMDFENYKNQEWLRRRKLRLEQVRKQSHDIAKALREKVESEEKLKNEIYQKVKEAEFNDWRVKRLAYLEGKLRSALEEFGKGYKLAAAEPDPNKIIQKRNKINQSIAQKRGEIAYYEELKMKKMEEERKMFPIQRKIMTRKMEDLRSALVRSVPVKKHLCEKCDFQQKECPMTKESFSKINQCSIDQTNKNPSRKVAVNKSKKKKTARKYKNGGKTCACKNTVAAPKCGTAKDTETIWINLNNVENSSTSSSIAQFRSIKSTLRSAKTKTSEGIVEFYDFPSRYFCRSYKEFPNLVERIEPSEPDAVELAKLEEEREEQEVKRRQDLEAVTQERGFEALKREKINRDYRNMICKLEELSKREKVLKSQQRSFPSVVHMTDERLLEWTRTRQRLMNSKFESIYYSVTADIPTFQPKLLVVTPEGGDYVDLREKEGTRLSFSAANLKQNSPVSIRNEELIPPIQEEKTQLFLDIEKTLREGRELRKTVSRNCDSRSESEETLKADRSVQAFPLEGTTCQESQTDDLKLEIKPDDSLPVSTSTSYKSPPSEIKSTGLVKIIKYLEELSDGEQNDPNFKRKVKKLFGECREESCSHAENGPTLEYYIKKLLNMSRECVASLSVSSENISTPNLTDLDVRDDEINRKEVNSKWEGTVRKSRVERADRLEEVIKTWKNILDRNIQEESETSESEDEPDGDSVAGLHQNCLKYQKDEPRSSYPPGVQHKYDQISKKCSERISELSNMLEKVRKDKEKLLTSTSGKSSDQDDIPQRFGTGRENESTAAMIDSQSYPNESLESWPDVMDELLRKEILTSPFKWSDGEHSPTNNPTTIETVIWDFRKEMNKIKNISFVSEDSFPMTNLEENKKEEESEGQESSTESINRALTSLGLNWAKSFLRKNEESRAMSSSSEGKSSGEEESD